MAKPNASAPLGQGGRFAALKNKLASRPGVTNPGALPRCDIGRGQARPVNASGGDYPGVGALLRWIARSSVPR